MDWLLLLGMGTTGVASAVFYEALKGDGWSTGFNRIAGAALPFVLAFFGIGDKLPAADFGLAGNGSEGLITAILSAGFHQYGLRGTKTGLALKQLHLVPTVLDLLAKLSSGAAKASGPPLPPANP